MSEPSIKIENLSKLYRLYRKPMYKVLDAFGIPVGINNYQEFWALKDINLEVNSGERVGIIGHNGAGKSTLLKLITKNLNPTSGKIQINGTVQALMELGTGFHPEFTGRENIRASLAYQGRSRKEIRELEADIIDFSELEEFIDQPIKTYSAGMYARLAFSTSTCIEPDILIIDEVLGAGDAYFAGKCVERMRDLTENGATVLFVSHDLGSVQRLCDRAIWIGRGQLKADGDCLETIKAYLADTRAREESRLKAKNRLLQQRQVSSLELENVQIGGKTLLFRLMTKDGLPPKQSCPIHSLSLKTDTEEVIAQILVGGVQDSDRSQPSHILLSPGYVNWGSPKVIEGKDCREFIDISGQYIHAPWHLHVPENFLKSKFSLEIKWFDNSDELIKIERHDESNYQFIGELTGQNEKIWKKSSFSIEQKKENADILVEVEKERENQFNNSSFGSGEVIIEQVLLKDIRGKQKSIFKFGDRVDVEVKFALKRPVDEPLVFGIDFNRIDGVWAFSSVTKDNLDIFAHHDGIVRLSIPSLRLGSGTYLISAWVYTESLYVDTAEKGGALKPLDFKDRAYEMCVESELGGISPQELSWFLIG